MYVQYTLSVTIHFQSTARQTLSVILCQFPNNFFRKLGAHPESFQLSYVSVVSSIFLSYLTLSKDMYYFVKVKQAKVKQATIRQANVKYGQLVEKCMYFDMKVR